jgi:hypothetical protein
MTGEEECGDSTEVRIAWTATISDGMVEHLAQHVTITGSRPSDREGRVTKRHATARTRSRPSAALTARIPRRGDESQRPTLEALGQDAPSGAVEPEGLGNPSSLVEEEVEVPVDGIEAQATHGAREPHRRSRACRSARRQRTRDGGRQAQHERNAPTTRMSVSSSKSEPSSIARSRTRTSYRASSRAIGAGTRAPPGAAASASRAGSSPIETD